MPKMQDAFFGPAHKGRRHLSVITDIVAKPQTPKMPAPHIAT
jgi:hypothetical protein